MCRNVGSIIFHTSKFVDFEKSMSCSGEHWGINKTSSLGKLRFNENINGFEGIVWQKISKNAHCYYIHKALRIYHTEGEDRLCNPKKKVVNYEYICKQYREICKESEYLNYLREYRLTDYASMMFYIVLVSLIDGNLFEARKFYKECKIIISVRRSFILKVFLAIGSAPAKVFFRLYWHSKSVVSV